MNPIESHITSLRGPILVTGASGFIGANLFKNISRIRTDVFAADKRGKNGRLAGVQSDRFINVDLTDRSAAETLVKTLSPLSIFDCAAYGSYPLEKNAYAIYETNFLATTNLVALLADRSIAAYVHAGSSSEYGTNSAGPEEDAPLHPNSHYAVSKVAAAAYLTHMGKHRHFPCVNLRLYSAYGPLEDASRLIPQLIRRALSGDLPDFVDAATSRDFVHVDDVCAAFILAASKMNPDIHGENFNIGTGEKTTIGNLAEIAKKVFSLNAEPRFGSMEARAWDLPDWYANPARARDLLGWQSTISLEQGLRLTANWVLEQKERGAPGFSDGCFDQVPRGVTAIVACYKDRDAIPVMHRRLTDTFQKIGIDYEIIFVNDGSPDDGENVVKEISACDSHVIGISHSRNFGSQMAFRSGMELASKDGVVLLDGDLQDPPELIESFYRKWEEGYDVVYGRRMKRDMPFLTSLGHKIFYRIFASLSYVAIPLDAGDFSLLDRRVVLWLLACTERDAFLRGLRAYVGFRQTGVPYDRPKRAFGRSTNTPWSLIGWAKKGIFSFSNAPLTILSTVGFFSPAIALLFAGAAATLHFFVPSVAPRGIDAAFIVALFFGSLNLLAIGVVGEYAAKIMLEVKGRPRLIRSSLIKNGEVRELFPDGTACEAPTS